MLGRLRGRLRRHLTYANVVSTICLFLVLGGVGYAASTARKNSVTSKSVKDQSLTGKDVKNDSLTGDDVVESSLKPVPSALHADSASTAGSASTADHASTADRVNGKTIGCPNGTTAFMGECMETATVPTEPPDNWILASQDCANRGGRLPTASELGVWVTSNPFPASSDPGGIEWSSDSSTLGVDFTAVLVFNGPSLANEKIGTIIGPSRCMLPPVH
jgi:hypothetical protein